jgi:hypothetical protein
MNAPSSNSDDGAPVEALPGLLERLERHWELLGMPLATMAAPGQTDAQIDELMAPTGMHLTEELRIWFRWHNGLHASHPQDPRAIVAAASWELRSLDYCVDLTTTHNRSDLEGYFRRQTWFDFCERGGNNEWLTAELGASGQAQAPVFFTSVDMILEEVVPVAKSVTQLVQLWVERLDAGRPTVTMQNDELVWHDESDGPLDEGRFD